MFDCPVCHSANLSDARACRSCGAALSAGGSTPASGAAHALPKGAQLQNRAFEIEALLGQGGRGLTYRGRDVALQRTVAIKEFFPPGSGRSDARVTAPPTMGETEFTTTRENFHHMGRVTDNLASGKVFADLGLPKMNPAEDRAMVCGSLAFNVDVKAILEGFGLVEGANSDPKQFVVEKAFVGDGI